ncbi:MAG: DUF3857 domain-containing transglutaminase family protein [Planctomycetes bacterium]|nr:DUF3857 domain-containing transglutaminase family protein [Planctomycetota bacterium]
MKTMRRLRPGSALLLLALCCQSLARADTIELYDGTRLEAERITYSKGLAVLDGERTIPRDQIKQIVFSRSLREDAAAPTSVATGDVPALLEQAAAAEKKYPDVGAITLIDDGAWTLRPDGTQVERNHTAIKIIKEPWKSLGEIGQSYEEGRDRITLLRARTIAPDGTVHELDPADLVEAKPTEGMVFFSERKTLTGHLPEVETGSIVETIWETEIYNPYDKELFFPRWYFGGTEPSLWSRVTIRVPEGRRLYYRVDNLPGEAAEPLERDEDGYHVYQWELRDIEHIVAEPAMPPVGEVIPSVAASLFEDWDYLFDFLGRFQQEHMQVTPELDAKVAEIVGDSTTAEEKIEKIYHWLQREIRYISIKGSMGSGWSGHPATLTLQNGYGDCIDKAILFATMLDVVGIKASPVIIATYGAPADDRTLPTLYGNHAITQVELDGRRFHLDSTATTYRYPYFRFDDHGVTTINVLDREIGRVEVPPSESNALDVNLKARLDEAGNVQAAATLTMNGGLEAMLRMGLEQINKLLLKMVAQQALNAVSPGADLKRITVSDETDLSKPLNIKLRLDLPEYSTFAGDLMIFKMPLSEMATSFSVITALDERKYDVLSPTTFCLRQHMQLELPQGYVPKGLPEPLKVSTGQMRYEAQFRVDGPTLIYDDALYLDKRRISPADYGQCKRFLEDVAEYTKLPLFLYKTGEVSP